LPGAATVGWAEAIPPATANAARVFVAIVLNPGIGRIALGRTAIVAASVKNTVTTGWIGHDGRPPVGFCHGFVSGRMGKLCGQPLGGLG